MSIKRPVKILIGLATLWLMIYPVLFMMTFFIVPAPLFYIDSPIVMRTLDWVGGFVIPLHCLTIIIGLGLIGFYLFHIIKNNRVADIVRVISGIGLYLLPFPVMPIYFLLFVWREDPPGWARLQAEPQGSNYDEIAINESRDRPKINTRRNFLIIGGAVGAIVLLMIGLFIYINFVIEKVNQSVAEQFHAVSTPVKLDQLNLVVEGAPTHYQPVDPKAFVPVSTFENVTTWRENFQSPFLLHEGNIYLAMNFPESPDSCGSSLNYCLISAELATGKVNWQAISGSTMFLQDEKRIYTVAPRDFSADGIIAYDNQTGEQVWETHFTDQLAAGVGYLALVDDVLRVQTYYRAKYVNYSINTETGAIEEVEQEAPYVGAGEDVFYEGLRLGKPGRILSDSVIATDMQTGAVVWSYSDDVVVSNIAVAGPMTYFVTERNQLIAMTTNSGRLVGIQSMAPGFPDDYDFVNDSVLVAADGDLVAVYYGAVRQLSVFRFLGVGE